MQYTGRLNQRVPCAHGAVRHPRWAQNVSVDDADIADIAVVEHEIEVGTTEGAVDASDRSSRSCANRSSRARNRCWEERCCHVN